MNPEVRLLGGPSLIAADGRLVSGAAAQPRRIAVLAVLADAWPVAVTRDRLVGLIWPEAEDAKARRLLTQALYAVRQELGDVIVTAGRDLSIDADALRIDLIEFRRALADGFPERAAEIYRPALEGFHLREALEFEHWCDALRDDTRRRFLKGLERLVDRHEEDGALRDAAQWAERILDTSPHDAATVVRVIDLWERVGDRGAALAAAARYERRMRDELEIDPDPAVARRIAEIRVTTADSTPPPNAQMLMPAPAIGERDTSGPDPVPLPRRASPWRRLRWRLAAAIIGGAVLAALGVKARSESAAAAPTLEILPVDVRGDVAATSSLGEALTTMLIANLDGSGGVRVKSAPADTAPWGLAALGIGQSEGGRERWGVLTGDVVVSGNDVRLDAELRASDPRVPPIRATVTGSRDSLIALTERLSVQLVPAFYPELKASLDADAVRRAARVQALRRWLDGEMAMRRGAYDEAHRLLRDATTIDSSQGYTWYRRAMAAELAHRPDDADQSVAIAEAHEETLTERERVLIRAYAQMRAGDARAAEALVRRLTETDSRNRDAWFQLAEIAYHVGPLYGRPVDAARDAWRQVVALDSGDYPALQHAIRLEARARDARALASLLRRFGNAATDNAVAAESRVIAAYGLGDAGAIRRDVDALPNESLEFVHAMVAGLLEQPDAATEIARRMTDSRRPDAVRAEGHIALAQLAMAQGRVGEAWAELDRAAIGNAVAAAWWRAYFATLPFLRASDSVRVVAARGLDAARTAPRAAPLYMELAVDVTAATAIEGYLADLLRAAAVPSPVVATLDSISVRGRAACDATTTNRIEALCRDLERGASADRSRHASRWDEALSAVEALEMRVPYQFAGRSVFFARTRERFLRAQLLERAGRYKEAEAWYEATSHGARFDYVYLAPSYLGRARIRERQGDRVNAAAYYRRTLELWRAAGPELEELLREATAGLNRVSHG